MIDGITNKQSISLLYPRCEGDASSNGRLGIDLINTSSLVVLLTSSCCAQVATDAQLLAVARAYLHPTVDPQRSYRPDAGEAWTGYGLGI